MAETQQAQERFRVNPRDVVSFKTFFRTKTSLVHQTTPEAAESIFQDGQNAAFKGRSHDDFESYGPFVWFGITEMTQENKDYFGNRYGNVSITINPKALNRYHIVGPLPVRCYKLEHSCPVRAIEGAVDPPDFGDNFIACLWPQRKYDHPELVIELPVKDPTLILSTEYCTVVTWVDHGIRTGGICLSAVCSQCLKPRPRVSGQACGTRRDFLRALPAGVELSFEVLGDLPLDFVVKRCGHRRRSKSSVAIQFDKAVTDIRKRLRDTDKKPSFDEKKIFTDIVKEIPEDPIFGCCSLCQIAILAWLGLVPSTRDTEVALFFENCKKVDQSEDGPVIDRNLVQYLRFLADVAAS